MNTDLFAQPLYEPLASKVRPQNLDEYQGQSHLLAKDKPLRVSLDNKQLSSIILWGPPGVGKTTLARLIANQIDADFISISAVMNGIKELKEAVSRAKQSQQRGIKTLLFIDEIHRFNKAQQDGFLPYVEDGTFILIGATTENPSFELNNALLSRARVHRLKSLSDQDISEILRQALNKIGDSERLTDNAIEALCIAANGDARRALNMLEEALNSNTQSQIDEKHIQPLLAHQPKRFDKGGDVFYEQISALHKSVRGSDPDASLYWFARMLEAGADPLYIARRVVRMASEEVGNADPRALALALDGWEVQERLGSPEGELAVAQAIVYIAMAAKSNAVYTAYNAARKLVRETSDYDVPMHLRNAPTKLMSNADYGKGYRYAHDEPEAFAAGEVYLPEALAGTRFYYPVERGLEQRIQEKLEHLQSLNQNASSKRYENKESS